MRFLYIRYDEETADRGEPISLFDYLINEFDNSGIVAFLGEFPTADAVCAALIDQCEPDDPAWDIESSQEEHERNNAAIDAADRAADRAELASLGAWGIQR